MLECIQSRETLGLVIMLQQYRNGETRGPQSALMWGQAANLSTEDMENIQAYIDTL